MRRTCLTLLLLLLVSAAPRPDADEQSAAAQWIRENVSLEFKELRYWRAVDYSMSADGFVQKPFRVIRGQFRIDGKIVDRVFMIDPQRWTTRTSEKWDEIKLNEPTAESWYKEKFELIHANDKVQR